MAGDEEKIPVFEIDHVQIVVPRERAEEAARFYGGVLGLREIPKPPQLAANGGWWYEAGPLQVHVSIEDGSGPGNGASRRHVAYCVADLEAAARHFREAGVEVIADTQPVESFRRFYVRDPGGNRIEVMSYDAARSS